MRELLGSLSAIFLSNSSYLSAKQLPKCIHNSMCTLTINKNTYYYYKVMRHVDNASKFLG